MIWQEQMTEEQGMWMPFPPSPMLLAAATVLLRPCVETAATGSLPHLTIKSCLHIMDAIWKSLSKLLCFIGLASSSLLWETLPLLLVVSCHMETTSQGIWKRNLSIMSA